MENQDNPPIKQSLTTRLNKFFFGETRGAKDIDTEHRSTLRESKILPKTWFDDEYSTKK